jgi:putative hydrolase of the HAD superfamily
MSLRAVIFDLDDTLLVDEASSRAVFAALARWADARGLDGDRLVGSAEVRARELHRAGPVYDHCYAIGISAFECLWGHFDNHGGRWDDLREWAPRFREQVWAEALREQGVEDLTLARELAIAWQGSRRATQNLIPHARETVEHLKERFILGMLTNGAPDLQREKIASTGLAHHFAAIAVSGEIGIGKPQPGVFHWLLERLGVGAAEAVMVGNSLERDIAGARAAGMRSVFLDLEDPEPNSEALADAVIFDLAELPTVLSRLDGTAMAG